MAVHVARHVLELRLDGVHVLGHLERQQAGGLDGAGEDTGKAGVRDVEAAAARARVARPSHEDDVRVGLDLGEHHRVVGVHNKDELCVCRELGLGVDHEVKAALVRRIRRLSVVAAVLHGDAGLGPVLGPCLAVCRVARKRNLAHRCAIGGIGAVLQRDGHVRNLVAGLGSEHSGRALNAVVGILRVLDLDDRIFDIGQVLGRGANDIAFLVLSLGFSLERRAGRRAHGVGHDIEVVRCDLLVETGRNRGGRGSHETRRSRSKHLRDVDPRLRAEAILGHNVAGVLEHDDALVVAVISKLQRRLVGEDLLGGRLGGEGLIKELRVDHELEDAPS